MTLSLEPPLSAWETQSINLDGVPYIIEYQWSERKQSWYISLYDSSIVPILQGVRLVPWVSILGDHPQAALPDGDLVLLDLNSEVGQGKDYPTFEDFGTRYILVYYTAEELQD